jgi:transcriptional regulator with XRE-family HTH domain
MTTEQIDGILARIGPALREAREEIGLSQQDVTAAAGLAENLLSRHEAGQNIPRPDMLYRILEVVTLDFVDFFERVTTPIPELKTPKYHEAAPDVHAAILAAMQKIVRSNFTTTRDWSRVHGTPNNQQWAQYEAGGLPSISTILRFCQAAKIDWLYLWADAQGRLDGGRP